MGLLDAFSNLDPEQNRGLLAAAAQMLQASGPQRMPVSLGQVIGSGVEAYQHTTDLARRRKLQEEEAAQMSKLRGLQMQDIQSEITARDAKLSAPVMPEFDTKPQVGVDETGKPFQYLVAKSGEVRRLDGILPRDKAELVNLGGKEMAYNPYALQPGQTFERTVSPDTHYSGSIAMRGQNMTDARQREANTNSRGLMNEERQLRIDTLRGKAEERKLAKDGTAASLRTQIGVIDKALDHPGRTTATGFSSVLDPRNFLPGTNATDFRVVADQLGGGAFLQAFESLKGAGQITEIEGQKATAAIARLNRAQSDSEYETALYDLREVINSGLVRSGAMPAPERPRPGAQPTAAGTRKSAIPGQVLDGYRFKGGNPADPKSWEKL